jgi:alkanesulfonate monooxygenase SsuD/methylene tetrahydromethanopterin reductase-like flavin-dependent oxidoreductase (luciferase family)
VAGLEAAVGQIRSLLRGEPVDAHAGLAARMQKAREVPIWIAAGGPRTLRMAGRVCDGVYLRVGKDPSNLRSALTLVHEGASEAGRDPGEVGIGLVLHTIRRQNPREIAAISRSMAAGFYEYSPALFDSAGIEWNGPPISELHRLVRPDFHHAADLVASGEVVSFLSDRAATAFSLFGTPADIAAQLRESITILGAVDVIVPHPVPTPTPDSDFSRWFAEDVMPLV